MVILLALMLTEVGRAAYGSATFGTDTTDLSDGFVFSRSGVHTPLRHGPTTIKYLIESFLSLSYMKISGRY